MSAFNRIVLMRDINRAQAQFRKAHSHAMAGFGQLAKAAIADGALSAKHEEPIAVSIAVAQGCSGCIGFHVKARVQLGCTCGELEEALAVCVYRGGGPAPMHSAKVIVVWDKLSA